MTAAPLRVLVIDDEPPIRKLLRMGLATQGYQVLEAPNGKTALELLAENPDLIILDLGLPDMQGLDCCGRSAARNDKRADRRPVEPRRRGRQGRRRSTSAPTTTSPSRSAWTSCWPACARRCATSCRSRASGRCSASATCRSISCAASSRCGDEEVKLSPKEYDLLRVLVQHAGKVLTHRFLLGELWDPLTDAQYLRVYVRQLRQKIEADPERPQYILTETGIGYRLRAPDMPADM